EEREVDALPAAALPALEERGEDRAGRVHAGHEVGDRHAHLLRAAAGEVVALAGDAHEAAQPLDHEVVAGPLAIGAVLAEAGDRAVDEAGVVARERLVIEPV